MSVLVVIGPHWLDAKDESGQRASTNGRLRCDRNRGCAHPRHSCHPCFSRRGTYAEGERTAGSLQPLVRRQAVEVRHSQFGRDAEALIKKIQPSHRGDQGCCWRQRQSELWSLGSIIPLRIGHGRRTESAPLGVDEEASAQREEERKAKAASEAEAKRKAEQAEQQRLAARKAEEDRRADRSSGRERYSNVVDQGLAARDSGDLIHRQI